MKLLLLILLGVIIIAFIIFLVILNKVLNINITIEEEEKKLYDEYLDM
jgi:hypothetical protein